MPEQRFSDTEDGAHKNYLKESPFNKTGSAVYTAYNSDTLI
jgi:hypothetical protein